MIGLGDGWMGLMESRPSGCYIGLRCGMGVGGRPVAQEIAERFPYTLRIAVGGIVLATLLGLFVGVTAAVYHNRLWDNLIMVFTLVAVSTPSYWLALMLMLVFSLGLGLVPSIGVGTPMHYVLP